MGKRRLGLGLTIALLAAGASAQPAPERKVEGTLLVSARQPHVNINVPAGLAYVGATRFVLYGNADCEIHLFVESGADGMVKRLVWVQFEGYLPEKPEARYGYNSPRHATLGGLDFFLDLYPRAMGDAVRAGSDREHVEAMLAAHGARLAAGMMYVRLVHLLDEQKRRELMIIYGEPLPDQSIAPADLMPGGSHASEWPALSDPLAARAIGALRISE